MAIARRPRRSAAYSSGCDTIGAGPVHRHDWAAVPARSGVDHAGVRFFLRTARRRSSESCLSCRRSPAGSVRLLGTTTNPDGRWTTQQIRDLVIDLGDRPHALSVFVRDRAGRLTAFFDAVLADLGIRVRIPPRCPRAACSAKRFGRTVRPTSPIGY